MCFNISEATKGNSQVKSGDGGTSTRVHRCTCACVRHNSEYSVQLIIRAYFIDTELFKHPKNRDSS